MSTGMVLADKNYVPTINGDHNHHLLAWNKLTRASAKTTENLAMLASCFEIEHWPNSRFSELEQLYNTFIHDFV